MRIAVLAYGTRGDTQPCMILARMLAAAGHDVIFGATGDARAASERLGLQYAPISGDARALMESAEGQRMLAAGSVLTMARRMAAYIHDITDEVDRDIQAICADRELIIAHMLIADRAASVAERHGQRLMVLMTVPVVPTGAWTSPVIDAALPGDLLRRLSHTLAHRVFWYASRGDLNRGRARLGLPLATRPAVDSLVGGGTPILSLHSRHLLPAPPDWPAHCQVVGTPCPDPPMRALLGEQAMSDGVSAFLDRGEAPFFIGFGSMPVLDPAAMLEITGAALEAVGGRAIIGAGWTRLPPSAQSPRICTVGAVDHDRLLPRCAAMIHHGGTGTTAAAARAGIPAGVLSVFGDQHFWGRQVEALGIGVHARFRRLTRERLIGMLRALRDPARIARAAAVGEQMRAEDTNALLLSAVERSAGSAPIPHIS